MSVSSILAKIEASPSYKKKVEEAFVSKGTTGATHDQLQNIGSKFVMELRSNIISYGLGDVRGMDTFSVSEPEMVAPGKFEIGVSFADEAALRRDSLAPDLYPRGLDNVARIMNNGYHAKGHTYGVWEGHTSHPIRSRKDFAGYRFMQQTANDFKRRYASQGVIDVTVSDEYS